jgi:hypothetical protein
MRKALLGLIFIIAIVCSLCAQETREETEKTIEYPHPMGGSLFCLHARLKAEKRSM